MSLADHTFFRLVSHSYRWAIGERAHRLTQMIAAYAPNAYAEATRQICRWLFPLDSTPVDALPHMLRLYNLPTYADENYFDTIARLRDAMLTHHAGGSVDQLLTEVERWTGETGFTIVLSPEPGETRFAIAHALVGDRRGWGPGPTYGRGACWGYQVPDINWTRNAQRAMYRFKPARERFMGFVTEGT